METIFEKNNEKEYIKSYDNKDIYPYLVKNKKTISDELSKIGITRVVSFNQLGNDFDKWKSYKDLILAVMPECSDFNCEDIKDISEDIKLKFAKNGITLTENHFISTFSGKKEDITYNKDNMLYFKEKNLVVALINPFYDNPTYKYFVKILEKANLSFMKKEDVDILILSKRINEGIVKKRKDIVKTIEEARSRLENHEKYYKEEYKKVVDLEKEREILQNSKFDLIEKTKSELMEVKTMPVIQLLEIGETIKIGFGDIYLTEDVVTGKTKKNGVEVPIVEKKKIKIGKLVFDIGTDKITCKNLTYTDDDYPHPHATKTSMCFGEVGTQVAKMLVEFELVKIVKMLYSWAHSYSIEGGPHKRIQYFYDREHKKVS